MADGAPTSGEASAPRGGDAREPAAEALTGGAAAVAAVLSRQEAEAGLAVATLAARAAVVRLEAAQQSFERMVGEIRAAISADTPTEAVDASRGTQAELAAASLAARAAVAQLESAQRWFAQMVHDEYGAAGRAVPQNASEACAQGAALVRSARAEAAQLDSVLWESAAPAESNREQGPRGGGLLGAVATAISAEASSRVFNPLRPEGPPPRRDALSVGGRFPDARPLRRCTWCHQPIRLRDSLVCAGCDAVFCSDCAWSDDDESTPERNLCARCDRRCQSGGSSGASGT